MISEMKMLMNNSLLKFNVLRDWPFPYVEEVIKMETGD